MTNVWLLANLDDGASENVAPPYSTPHGSSPELSKVAKSRSEDGRSLRHPALQHQRPSCAPRWPTWLAPSCDVGLLIHAGILRARSSGWMSLFLAIPGQETIHVVTDPVAEPMTYTAHGIEAGKHGVTLPGRQGSRHLECLLEHPHQSVVVPCIL